MMIDARTQIVETAFAVLADSPTASLAEIAAAAGVGRATLHRHFKGREDLLEAMAHRAVAEIDDAVAAATAEAESHAEALRLTFEALAPLAHRLWFLANEPLERIPSVAAAYAAQRAELEAAIEAAKGEGAFAADAPLSWIVAAYEALVYAAWEQVRDQELTPRQATSLAWRTLTNGLKGEA